MASLDYTASSSLIVLLSTFFANTWSQSGIAIKGPFDVCERETFNASCGPNQVVLMKSSMYGIMQLGRCIRDHFGKVDCNVDVKHIMDGFCSGLNSCAVKAVDPLLLDSKRCPSFAAYLQASYSCLDVLNDQSHSCGETSQITANAGYLSSSLRTMNGAGTSRCPWKISSQSSLNITLFKFVPFKTSPLSSSSSVCFEIGVIQEGRMSHGILSCGSDSRVKVIHLSSGGQVSVHFKDRQFLSDLGNFVLHFEAIGCKEPSIPADSAIVRSDNRATITCDNRKTKWEITCQDGRWQGEVGECPSDEPQSLMHWIRENTRFSLGLLAMVTVGCALVIFLGGFCLYVTFFYITRKSRAQAEATANYTADIYKLQTMQRLKRPPSIAVYERTTSLPTPPGTMRRNTDYQRMNPIDPDTVSHHSYVLYDHVPKPLPPIPIDLEKKHIYETPHRPESDQQ